MKTSKVMLRNGIRDNLIAGNSGNSTDRMMQAAVYYGVYRALGGNKVFALAPIYQNIVTVVEEVASIKIKADGKSRINYLKVAYEINKMSIVNDCVAVEYLDRIQLNMMLCNGEKMNTSIMKDGNTEIFSKLAFEMIVSLDKNIAGNINQVIALRRELGILSGQI